MKMTRNKFLIIFILVVAVVALSYRLFFATKSSNSAVSSEKISFRGPTGQPQIKGPLEPPPTVFNSELPLPTTEEVVSFFIEGDDKGLSRNPIYVIPGKTIEITFHVKTENVDLMGLRFSSSYFDTGLIAPGKEKTVQFIAPQQSFVFSFLDGDGGAKKTEGKVVVQ